MVDRTTALVDLVGPIIDDHDAHLYDLTFESGILGVLVDAEPAIDLDTVAYLSRQISRALDDADLIGGSYTLEVSSPGLERPLRTAEHFAAAVGELVTVRLKTKIDGTRRVAGTLVAADESSAIVESDDGNRPLTFPIEAVQRARTIFVWDRGAKPGETHPASARDRKATT